MNHFVQRIQTPHGSFNFYFNRTSASDSVGYHISLIGPNSKLCVLNMIQRENGWIIENTKEMESWLLQLESTLNEAIQQQTNEY
jgi:hypothetical protein